ncbi:MAG TPA: hypothetical protein VH142_06450, partial [Polyangiaceae bacterium]|nr:hypothetical protein [Polyangiaceae bacterium]
SLHFSPHGTVLMKGGRICWASASSLRPRLTDRLRQQRTPPLKRAVLESVFEECKRSGEPVGQALVARGVVSEEGLRAALLGHTSEALAHLGRASAVYTDFVSHSTVRNDMRFAFTPVELLAASGARRDLLSATAARARLESIAPTRDAFAFLARGVDAHPAVVAVRGCSTRKIAELLEAAASVVHGARALDNEQGHLGCLLTEGPRGQWLVSWSEDERRHVVFCDSIAECTALAADLTATARHALQ